MRAFGLLPFIFILGLQPQSALSSTNGAIGAEVFSKTIANSKQWKELIHQVEGALPKNVTSELSNSAENLGYPDVSYRNSELQLKDPNGGWLNIRLEKGGKVFFDNTEWKLHPLASTSEEMNRISEFMENRPKRRNSLIDRLFPSAYAAPGSFGIALVAHIASTGWKAEEYIEQHPSSATKLLSGAG